MTDSCLCCLQREAQLQKLRGEAAVAEGRQLSDEEWAERAGLPSVKALHKALEAGQAAGLHIVKVNMGLLMKLTGKFHSQVRHPCGKRSPAYYFYTLFCREAGCVLQTSCN